MTLITDLFNQKHSLNIICVGYFILIELEVGQQRPLQIKTYRTGVRTRGRLSLLPLHVLCLLHSVCAFTV